MDSAQWGARLDLSFHGVLDERSFRGSGTRWSVPDVRSVRLAQVPSVNEARSVDIDLQGMAGIGSPRHWRDEDEISCLPDVWCLEGAHVFGGMISGRDAHYHWDGQLVVPADGSIIPASFGVIDGNMTLARGLVDGLPGTPVVRMPEGEPRVLEGVYVLLGNFHRHWGHAVLEGLTRLWVKRFLREGLPVKWLVYDQVLRPFAWSLLHLAGISRDDVVIASEHDVVERLIVPDAGMRSHRWITTAQTMSWDLVKRVGQDPRRKIFLSRSAVELRRCADEAWVEDLFRESGWEIVRPEEYPVREQVIMAGEAKRLAGFVGSQMYLAAFQPDGGDNLVIAPENFFLRDDLLISGARKHHLEVVLGTGVSAADPVRSWGLPDQAKQRIESLLAGG